MSKCAILSSEGSVVFFQLTNVRYFLKVQVVPKPFACRDGKFLLVKCHP